MARLPILDHAGDAKARLPGYLAEAENFNALLSIVGARAQLLETDNNDLFDKRSLDNAQGQQLDNIGDILGELRNNRIDSVYRAALSVRILINTSFGTISRIQEIALAFADADTASIVELFPANLEVIIKSGTFDDLELTEALQQSRPLGVRLLAIDQIAPIIPPGSDLDDPADYADPANPAEVGIRFPFGTRISTDPATSTTRGGYASLIGQGTTGATPAGSGLTNIFNDAGATFIADGVLADFMLNVHGVGIFQVLSTPVSETQLILKNAAISEGLSNLTYHVVSPVRAGIYSRIV